MLVWIMSMTNRLILIVLYLRDVYLMAEWGISVVAKNTFLARLLQILTKSLQNPCKILQDDALFLQDHVRFLQEMYAL